MHPAVFPSSLPSPRKFFSSLHRSCSGNPRGYIINCVSFTARILPSTRSGIVPTEVILRIVAIPLILALVFFVAACDDDSSNNANNINNTNNTNNTNNNLGYCGDSLIRGDEECDDGNFQDGDGCSSTCMLEYSCGDGTREFTEICDDADFGGRNCVSEGYLTGELQCSESCTLDLSTCSEDATGLDILGWYKLDSLSGQEYNYATSTNLCVPHSLREDAIIRDYPSPIGSGIFFDGSFDLRGFMDCGPGFNGMDQLTVEAWIEVGTYPMDLAMIVSSVSSYDATGLAFYLGLNGDFKLEAAVGDWDNVAVSTSNIITREWHHVAFTYDGSEITIFLDGEVDSVTAHAVGGVPTLSSDNSRVYLANNYLENVAEMEHYYTGGLDELKLWSVVRTQEEICYDAGGVFNTEAETCLLTVAD
ncbi:hypothetical protein KKF84_20595 [Myxococcota bacterium]|nr:hypothetical protein [Myxococcota bacterium]